MDYVTIGMAALYGLGLITKVTPTPKDDKWYGGIMKIVRVFGLSPENYKDKWGL